MHLFGKPECRTVENIAKIEKILTAKLQRAGELTLHILPPNPVGKGSIWHLRRSEIDHSYASRSISFALADRDLLLIPRELSNPRPLLNQRHLCL